jgi:pimeloyl-ACP methyl ester carboxylesterase
VKIKTNGVELNVNDTGIGDTTLVFLHHMGGSSKTWSDVTSRLSRDFRCIAIDARGAGDSEATETGYSIRNLGNDVLGVIATLRLKRYIVIGHSMGGKIAQYLASTHPAGLVGIVLVAASPPSPMVLDDATREQYRGAYANRAAVEGALDNALVGSLLSTEAREQLIADSLRTSTHSKNGWIDIGSRDDIIADLKAIEVPVTIIAGDKDKVDSPEVVKSEIAIHYPSAAVHFIADKGHVLPLEAPAELTAIIGEFAAPL